MTVRGCFLTLALACSALGDEAAALRLVTHWQFADQTDVHNELVIKYHPKRNGLMLSNTWGDRAFSPIAGFLYAYLAAPVAGGREFSVRISVETKGHQGR